MLRPKSEQTGVRLVSRFAAHGMLNRANDHKADGHCNSVLQPNIKLGLAAAQLPQPPNQSKSEPSVTHAQSADKISSALLTVNAPPSSRFNSLTCMSVHL